MSIDMDTNGSVDQEEFHNAYLKIDFAHNLGVERKRRLSQNKTTRKNSFMCDS